MAFRALLVVSLLAFALPALAQEKRTALTTEDLDRAKALDAEFEKLLGSETRAVRLELESARTRIFDKVTAWEYQKGLRTVRVFRPKAAVPLLIEALLVQYESPFVRRAAADALKVLTGKAVPDLWNADLDTIANAAKDLKAWWDKEKDTLTTDLEKMTEAQLEGVVERAVFFDWELDHVGGGHPYFGAYDEELSGRMVPALLAALKVPDPEKRAAAGRLLGRLRKKTGGKELEAIAKDPKQQGGLRLTAILALHSAGDDLRFQPLGEILDAALAAPRIEAVDPAREAALKSDVIAAIAEVCAKDKPAAQAKLTALLDDADAGVRVAALRSLANFDTSSELPRLKKMLLATRDVAEATAVLTLFAGFRTPESVDVLGEYLKAALKPSPFNDAVRYGALTALGYATGNRWIEAGAHPPAYYMEQAKKGVEWWEANRKK